MGCKCGSDLIVNVNGKTNDTGIYSCGETERDGYVPHGLGIGGGDYIRFKFCANCGTIQGFKPLCEESVIEAIIGE